MRADAPYKTVQDLLAAIKANPGKFKASGTGQGGIWHLALAGLLKDQKIDPASVPWVPSNGAAPGCRTWSPAASRSRRVAAGSALADRRRQGQEPGDHERQARRPVPERATLKAALGSDWTMAAWRGIVAPKGIPGPVRDRLAAAVQKAANSKEYQDFMASRGFGVIYAGRTTSASSWPSRTPNWARR